jgi:hypothetical protein
MLVQKTPKTLWEKQEKSIVYNVIIVPIKTSVGKKNQEINIDSLKPIVRKLLKQTHIGKKVQCDT